MGCFSTLWDAYAQVRQRIKVFALVSMIVLVAIAISALIYRSRLSKMRTKALEEAAREDDSYKREQASNAMYNAQIPRRISLGIAVFALVLALYTAFASMVAFVPTKDIGVVTTFGAPTGSEPNGAHFKAPWQDVTLMDGAIQTDTHNKVGNQEDCIKVRIAHQIVACANTYVKWQVKESSVDTLFQNYREFDNIRDSLVTKNLQSVLNSIFESYDPLAVDPKTGNSSAPELSILSQDSLGKLKLAVGDQIDVKELSVTVLNYDDATQRKINDLQGQVAQTRIAEQAIQTAQKQADANAKLASSVSKDPNVLVSKCYDLMGEMVAKGQQLPAGFSCWPGSGSAVVVPQATPAKK